VIAFDLYASATLAMRMPRLRIVFSEAEKRYLRVIIVAVLALNWLYSLSHWRNF